MVTPSTARPSGGDKGACTQPQLPPRYGKPELVASVNPPPESDDIQGVDVDHLRKTSGHGAYGKTANKLADSMDEMYWGMDAIDDRAGLEEDVEGYPFVQNFTLTNPGTLDEYDDGFETCTGEWMIEEGATAGNNWRRIERSLIRPPRWLTKRGSPSSGAPRRHRARSGR